MAAEPQLHVTQQGEGPTILFLHGWLNDAAVWAGVMDNLAVDHRCLALDLRGHGRSEAAPAGEYDRDRVLGDIRVALHNVDNAIVVGHSLGGYLALALAIESPELVSGLGLVAAGPGFRNPESREKWNESVKSMAADRDIPPGQEQISMHVDSMVMDRLGEIETPAVVVVGERDKRFLTSADVFARHLNVISQTVVPDAGHMVHAKQPEAVATALRALTAT